MGNVCCWDKLWSTWRSPVIGWQITNFDHFLTIYSIFWPIKLTAILADHSPALLEWTSWSARRLQWRKKDITFTFPFPQILKVPRKALSRFFRKESLFFSKKNGQLPFFSGWAAAWQLEFGIDRKILVAKFLLIRCERSSLLGGSKISWDYQVTWLDLGSLCGWVWACLTGPPLTINCRRTQAKILLGGGGGLQSAEQYSEQQSQRDRAGEAEAADRERYGAAARCCGVRLRLSLPISICWEKSRCDNLPNSLLLRCGLQGCFTLWTVRLLPCHCLICSTCKGV